MCSSHCSYKKDFQFLGLSVSWGISIQFTDVGIMIALIGSAIIKVASFYQISKNDVIDIMKGDNYVYNEGNNDWLIWKYRYIGSIDFGMMIVYRNGDNSYYKCKSDDGTEFF